MLSLRCTRKANSSRAVTNESDRDQFNAIVCLHIFKQDRYAGWTRRIQRDGASYIRI